MSAADGDTRGALAKISAKLAADTGQVETARADNRQGFAVGSIMAQEARTDETLQLIARGDVAAGGRRSTVTSPN